MVKDHRARSGSFSWETWLGENELWRYMGFDDDPRTTLTMSDPWHGISPAYFSVLTYRMQTIHLPMGCNKECMKSSEKTITSPATHRELRVSSLSPGLRLEGRGE